MLERIKNLWAMSEIEITKSTPTSRQVLAQIKEAIVGKKMATIVEDDPINQFPQQDEHGETIE